MWPLLVSEEYTKHVPIPSAADQGGEVAVSVQDGRLVLAISSHRDFTGQIPPVPERPAVEQPVVGDFYVQADVELTEGPQDGFCGLLFGWKGNEHWYAMKVGQSGVQVTQNPGTVPHTRLFGTVQPPALKMSSSNQLGILARGGEVRFYVNDRQVSLLHIDDTTGQILVAAQAANTPDVLRCAFGHVRLWGLKLPHDLLGGLELDSYCQSRAYAKATLTSPQVGSDAARKNWACTSGETPQLIDIDGACKWQYRRNDAVGWADNDDDAYTWKCFTSS
jgi:hypothetical protein